MSLAFHSARSGRHAQSRAVVERPSKVSKSSHMAEMSQLFVIFSLRFPCALILREENPTFLKFSSLGSITIFWVQSESLLISDRALTSNSSCPFCSLAPVPLLASQLLIWLLCYHLFWLFTSSLSLLQFLLQTHDRPCVNRFLSKCSND